MAEAEAKATQRAGEQPRRTTRDLAMLWCALLLPPLSWVADFMGRYALSRWTFQHGTTWPLRALTTVTVLSCGLGAILGWYAGRRARAAHSAARATAATWAIAMAGYFIILILAEFYPVTVLDVRELTQGRLGDQPCTDA